VCQALPATSSVSAAPPSGQLRFAATAPGSCLHSADPHVRGSTEYSFIRCFIQWLLRVVRMTRSGHKQNRLMRVIIGGLKAYATPYAEARSTGHRPQPAERRTTAVWLNLLRKPTGMAEEEFLLDLLDQPRTSGWWMTPPTSRPVSCPRRQRRKSPPPLPDQTRAV